MTDFINTNKTETEEAVITSCSSGIIKIMFKPQVEVTASVFKMLFELFNQIENSKPSAFIYYAQDSSVNVTEEARRYAKTEEHAVLKVCIAIVVNNLAHRLLANFYLKFNKPSYPFKVFSKMEDAEKWCLPYLVKVE